MLACELTITLFSTEVWRVFVDWLCASHASAGVLAAGNACMPTVLWRMQTFLQLHAEVLRRSAPDAAAHVVASPAERRNASATLAAVTQHMQVLRASAQLTALHAAWLPQYAMLTYMAEQLTNWLQGGYEGSVSLYADAGMRGAVESVTPELLAAHQAIQQYE